MPLNPIDDALDRVEESMPMPRPRAGEGLGFAQPDGEPTRDAIDDALDRVEEAYARPLRRTLLQTAGASPERAAEARRLAGKFGVPAPIVERNLEEFRRRDEATRPVEAMQRETPALSRWLEQDPTNAAVARDDLEQLGLLEWITTAPQRAFAQSVAQMRVSELRTKQLLTGSLTREELDQLNAERFYMEHGGELGARGSWFRGAVTGGSRLLANVLFGFTSAAQAAAIGAGAGAIIGGAGGALAGGVGVVPGATGGAAFGARVGAAIGGARFGFELEAGLAYDEFLEFRDELGQPIDPDAARAAALAAGAINAGLEAVGLGILARSIPGLSTLTTATTRSAVKQALRNPTVRAALGQLVKEYGTTLTSETAVEVAQRAVTLLSGELAKVMAAQDGQQFERLTREEFLTDLAQEAAGAAQSFSLLSLPGPSLGFARNRARAQRARDAEAWFQALGEGVAQSKTIQRAPEAAEAFLTEATKDGPVPTLYAPVETFAQYWQSQGLDPREVATELTGDPDAYDTAIRTGEDLAIPTARYAVRLAGTEHHQFFARELRIGPDEMNAREREAFEQQLAAQQAQEVEAEAAQPAEPTVPDRIRALVTERLEAAGVPRDTAESYAQLYGAYAATFERAGLDPAILLQRLEQLTIERPDLASSLETAPTTPEGLDDAAIRRAFIDAAAEGDTDTLDRLDAEVTRREAAVAASAAAAAPTAPEQAAAAEPAAPTPAETAAAERTIEAAPEAQGPGPAAVEATPETIAAAAKTQDIVAFPADQVDQIQLDPATYQFKTSDARGRTAALEGVGEWDPWSPPIVVHRTEDGQLFVADGHQRFNLYLRLKEEGQELPPLRARIVEGDVQAVMRAASLRNVQEGSADPIDIARLIRAGGDLTESERRRIGRLSSVKLRQGQDLARLGDDAFRLVLTGQARPEYAAFVGRYISDPAQQARAVLELGKANLENLTQAEAFVKELRDAGFVEVTTQTLFGEQVDAVSLAATKAKIFDAASKSLSEQRRAFKGALQHAKRLEAAGNVIIRDINARLADEAGQLRGYLEALYNLAGTETNRAANDQALAVHQKQTTVRDAAAVVLDALRADLQSGTFGAAAAQTGRSAGSETDGSLDRGSVPGGESALPSLPLDLEQGPARTEPTLEVLDDEGLGINASVESAASLEALRRQAGMRARGEQFVVYDRAGRRRVLIGPDAVDYRPQPGETFGVETPAGFYLLEERGGKAPRSRPALERLFEFPGREFFQPAFRSAVPFDWATRGQGIDREATFTIDDRTYRVIFESENARLEGRSPGTVRSLVGDRPGHIVDVRFALETPEGRAYDLTGTGDAIPVFSTVLSVIDDYLATTDEPVSALLFSALEPSRQRLYRRMARAIAGVEPRELRGESIGLQGEYADAVTFVVDAPPSGVREFFQTAFHGSPHIFDRFSLHAIGSGEGHQAFGWGLYFASERAVAERYREMLSRDRFVYDGELVEPQEPGRGDPRVQARYLVAFHRDAARAERVLRRAADSYAGGVNQHLADWYAAAADEAAQLDAAKGGPAGRVYAVEIPDAEDFLDWDRPASQQSDKAQAVLRALGFAWTPMAVPPREEGLAQISERLARARREFELDPGGWTSVGSLPDVIETLQEGYEIAREGSDAAYRAWYERHVEYVTGERPTDPTGEQVYRALVSRMPGRSEQERSRAASETLAAHGLAGIRYLDQFSRGRGEGTHNYVIFDDRLIEIVEFEQSATLTPETLAAFAEEVRARHDGLEVFDLRLTPQGDISLETIAVERGRTGTGIGARVMADLIAFADRHGRRIVLQLAEKGFQPVEGGAVTSSTTRLKAFYRRFGFVENKGRNKRYELSIYANMYREPQAVDVGTVRDLSRAELRAEGFDTSRVFFHQTAADNVASILEEGFDLGRGLARLSDEGVPDGVFLKPTDADIGLGAPTREGRAQIPVHVRFGKTLEVADRAELARWLASRDPEYARLAREARAYDETQAREFDRLEQSAPFEEISEQLDAFLEEWKAGNVARATAARARATEILREAGYETVVIKNDVGSFGRATETIIAIAGNQVAFAERGRERVLFQQPEAPLVARLTGDELGVGPSDIEALRRAALDYYTRELQHGIRSVERPGFGSVSFTDRGKKKFRSTSADPDQLLVLPAAPAIIASGRYLGSAAPRKPTRAKIRAFHYFEGAVQLGDDIKVVTLTVFEDVNGGKFYNLVTNREAVEAGKRKARGNLHQEVPAPEPPPDSRRAGARIRGVEPGDSSIAQPSDVVNLAVQASRRPVRQDAPRGAIRFGPGQQAVIRLFERADLSTFVHESGHLFLELFGDVADELRTREADTLTDSQRRVLADYDALLRWLGVSRREEIGREEHEQFARGFEAYLFEGRAPSLELRSAFARFRAWLLGIYRSIRNLNVRLTDEVRGVFDRMLATDEAIAAAEAAAQVEPLFTTPEAAGMTPEEFALYRSKVEQASRTARERLEQRLLAEVQREREETWKRQRAEIRAAVEREVREQPVYRALAAMQRGVHPDGTPITPTDDSDEPTPLRLSRELLVQRFGEERLRRLPRPYIYTRQGGLDPEVVARQFGFQNAAAMLDAIEQAPPMRQAIELETDRRMRAEHGDILLDGRALEEAQVALANEDRDLVIRAELRALAQLLRTVEPFVRAERQRGDSALQAERREREYERRWFEAEAKLRIAIAEGRKQAEIDALRAEVRNLRQKARGGAATIRAAIPPATVLRDTARARIAATRVRDLQPERFWSAARRAAQKATEAAARQDFEAAIVAKQQELLNLALYREAAKARDDVEARVRRARELARPAARQRLGLAGESYLDQVDGILDRYEFAPVSGKALARRASLRKWVAALEAQGLPVDLPEELLEEAQRVNYRELTVEELVGITDGLEQIVHLARLKNRLLTAQRKRRLDEVASELAESIREHARRRPPAPVRDRRLSEERRRLVGDFFASHRKLASVLREMDGFQDGGPAWEAIMRPLNAAGDREADMNANATRRLAELFERAFPGAEKRRLYERMHIDAIGRPLSRMERIAVALNWGNEGNRDRIRRGERWSDAQVQAILDTLTADELQFVQGVFDFVDSFWDEIAAKQRRVYGIAPEKVEATPIRAAAGEIRGGYYPLKYDDRLSAKAIGHLELDAANLAKQAAYTQATTRRGHTKERQQRVTMPVRLDFGVLFEHVAQVIHDLTHHETLIDVGRIIGHPEVQRAILETYGDLTYRQIRNTVRDIAFGDVPAVQAFERVLRHLRTGATIVGLGWNVLTSILQPLGLANSVVRIGPAWVARGVGRWIRNPFTMGETVAWIEERSAFMRARGRTMQREIAEIRNQVGVSTGRLSGWVDAVLRTTTLGTADRQAVADSYFWLIQQAQRLADVPTWLGAYEKAMAAGETEDRAVALADQAVLDSQGGGQVKDLAQVQRGGPTLKLFTAFYSYFNVVYNQAVESARRTNVRNPAEVARLAVDYLMLFVVPASLGALVREAFRGGDDDDGLWAALIRENLSYLFGLMIGLRELSGVLAGFAGYEGPAGTRAFASLGRLARQIEQGEIDEALLRALNEAAGILFHYPAGQLDRSLRGVIAVSEGKAAPTAVVTGPPPARR